MNALAFRVATFNFPFGALVHDAKVLTSPLVHRRIPLEMIPEDEAECAAWLHKLYQEKVSVLNMCDRWEQGFNALFSLLCANLSTGQLSGALHPDGAFSWPDCYSTTPVLALD